MVKTLIALLVFSFPSLAHEALVHSEYEQQVINEGLKTFHLKREDTPLGKEIDEIFIYTRSPFGPNSGPLKALNYLHINSKDRIIKALIFFKKGDLYEARIKEDSEKNLRRGRARSMVAIVPVKAKDLNKVSLLVVTQDTFTLTPNLDLKWSADTLNRFSFFLAEENLLGLNKVFGAGYEINQGHHEASIKYKDKYFWQTPWQLGSENELFWLRKEQTLDGFSVGGSVKKPLLAEQDRYGFWIEAEYKQKSKIDFKGSEVRKEKLGEAGTLVERRYQDRDWEIASAITRSFGISHKQEVVLGHTLQRKNPKIPRSLNLTGIEKELFKEKVLPKNELESFVTLGGEFFENRYLKLYDYEKFALRESIRLGYFAKVFGDFSHTKITFGDYSFVQPRASLAYTLKLNDDAFLSVSGKTQTRFDGKSTESIRHSAELRVVTPTILKLGRLVLFSGFSLSRKDRDNKKLILGTQEGLRGAPSRFYRGEILFRENLEFRTKSIDIWISKAGLTLFYDVGSAFDDWQKVNPTHSLGLGLRMLWPQLSAEVMRLDVAIPFGEGRKHHHWLPSFGVGQAF